MPSKIAKKLAGTFIEDEQKPGAIAWLQEECRTGKLQWAVNRFVETQDEVLDAYTVLVDSVDSEIHCRIPAMLSDHESIKTFRVDVTFSLNPWTGETRRH